MNKKYFSIIASIIVLVLIDWGLKWFFSGPFQNLVFSCDGICTQKYFPILWDFFGIQLVYNSGIAFSLPIEWIFLKILTAFLLILLAWYFIKYELPKNHPFIFISFVCVMTWGISHGFERIFIGYVIDFFSVKNFAIFNFADILITIWALFLIFYFLLYERKK